MAVPAQSESRTRDMTSLLGGSTGVAALGQSKLMTVPKLSYPFLLRHHESNWQLATEGLEAPMLLPEIVPHILMAGAGGMRTVDKGQPLGQMYAQAKSDAIAKGWHYIPVELTVDNKAHLPDGVAAGMWCRSVEALRKGTTDVVPWYHTPWDVPVRTPADLPQKWRFDNASYNRWRLHLCLTGVIPAPIESVVDDYRARYGNHADRARSYNNPDREHKAAKTAAAEAVAKTVTSAALPGDKPAPKPGPKPDKGTA